MPITTIPLRDPNPEVSMSLVITGATGQLGRLVVESLLARGTQPADILATGRSVDKLADLAARGVRTASFDFDAPAEGILKKGDVLLLVSGSEPGKRAKQHGNVIETAKKAGVARIVYTSILGAGATKNPLAPEHEATEAAVRASGIPFTFLRNGWYTENYVQAFGSAKAHGIVLGSAHAGRVSSAPRADYAEAAARVLTEDGHTGKVYELAGDEAWAMADLAATFGNVLGRTVTYQDVSTEEHAKALQGFGLDAGLAGFLAALDKSIAEDELETKSRDLSTLLGRPTTPMPKTVATWG